MDCSLKILRGVDEICVYGKFSRPLFEEFVKMGLPAVVIRNIWWAHADNVDEFFRLVTMKRRMSEIPLDAE